MIPEDIIIPKTEVSVYVEGLLVQTRDSVDLYNWSKDLGMEHIADEMRQQFKEKYTPDKPWAYHFEDMNAYVLVRHISKSTDKKFSPLVEVPILVSVNQSNAQAPTLQIVATANSTNFPIEFIASLVTLARYYAVDEVILDGKEEETK